MKALEFWFDPVSPFAYLAFEQLPQALQGCSYAVEYRPVLFASLLRQWGHKGPAEIEPKRAWTFRHVHWLAHQMGIPIDTPAQHPFNPLPLLRLVQAAGPNRRSVEAVFRHAWCGGGDANDRQRLVELRASLAPALDPDGPEVKWKLLENSQIAVSKGLFGVPTIECEGRLFWGLDALPMLKAFLLGDAWFDGPAWEREGAPRPGVQRG